MNRPASHPRLRLHVAPAAERAIRSGHPWVFADKIRDQNRPATAGELAALFDRNDRFIAMGLFDPDSPIRVRIAHAGKPLEINRAFWAARLEAAIERRAGLFDARTTGYRLINGESDGWPGLVLDRYGDTLALKIYTAAWLPRLDEVADLIQSKLSPQRLVLRLSRNIQPAARKQFRLEDGSVLRGFPIKETVTFLENGLHFEADVARGQKTGFFLDQRDNRRRVETLSENRRVLNAFSFSGGFSLYAARGGAVSVTNLDISAHALDAARRNLALNSQFGSPIDRCLHEFVQADALEWLHAERRRRFDLVILDPPSFAKKENERAEALQAYERLVSLGRALLGPGGLVLACSCSAHVNTQEFFTAARRGAARNAGTFRELWTSTHAPDHPATFPEANYLKAICLRIDD
ncbi:MAG: class I SAM-dependent rRNA methyltransferase [Verrucomicrobiota bacterium]